ncbi:cytochrome P450 3A24-like isoform X2 [Watersipora subatra]
MGGISLINLDISMAKKYGKFVGTFIGSAPMLLVYDAEWAAEAFVKHFSVFTNRNVPHFGGSIDSAILSVSDDHWRHGRKTLSPVFTTLKLKQMIPAIQECCQVFVKEVTKLEGASINLKNPAYLLTLDVISTTAFGLQSNVQENPKGQFAKNAFLISNCSEVNSTLKEKCRLAFVVVLNLLFPKWLTSFLVKVCTFGVLNPSAVDYFESLVADALSHRKKHSEAFDLLQTMADSIVEDNCDMLVDRSGHLWTEKGLTKEEVTGNSLLFLFAGFQTTADSLVFFFYELAHHQFIQETLYQEIAATCDTKEIAIDQINKLKYLDACLNEALRLYPQGFRFDRVATEDINIQGIYVKKGTVVTVSPWVIHRNPDIWENPERFDPSRFLPENFDSKLSTWYIPFGLGNRKCIGSRLALLEMKIATISVLKAFRIEKNALTPGRPIKLKNTLPLAPLDTEQPMMVSFIKREF